MTKLTEAQAQVVSSADMLLLRRCGDGFTGRGNAAKRLQKAGLVTYQYSGLRLINVAGRAALAEHERNAE